MRSVAYAAAAVAMLTLGQAGGPARAPLHVGRFEAQADGHSAALASPFLAPSLCSAGAIPDGDACVRIPSPDDDGPFETPEPSPNAHFDRHGRWTVYDQIPRRPDRPADYDAYQYPVPCTPGCVISGYDLDRPDERQRRGRRLSDVGHGAVDLAEPRGTPIRFVALEQEEGDAEVVYVGPLFGTTVITRATLRQAGERLRDYLVLFGHLEAPAPGLAAGRYLKNGDPIGTVGDTGSPELVHLHLEVRRLRGGVDLTKLTAPAMIANESSIVCDPRNVLPLR